MLYAGLTPHYASDYSVFMALIDLVPVFLFFAAGVVLLKDLYNKLNKFNYALLSAGSIMVLIAGTLKAVWKIICALGICDFVVFNLMMMPIQAIGFLLCSVSLFGLFKKNNGEIKTMSFVPFMFIFFVLEGELPLEFTNTTMPFLVIQTIAASLMQILLMILAKKMHNTKALILIIISFVTMWGMGALAATQGKMSVVLWNWLEEIDNSVSQLTLLLGVLVLHKAGLNKEKLF